MMHCPRPQAACSRLCRAAGTLQWHMRCTLLSRFVYASQVPAVLELQCPWEVCFWSSRAR